MASMQLQEVTPPGYLVSATKPSGEAIGAPEKVNVTDYHTQSDPAAHQFADGSSVVAWSHSQNGSSFALKYQLFDASGQKLEMKFHM